jgi:CRISPR system Cascade subunit CasD
VRHGAATAKLDCPDVFAPIVNNPAETEFIADARLIESHPVWNIPAMNRMLVERTTAPLMSFGGDMIDANGPTMNFPLASLVTGLMANALGWTRGQRTEHQRLQSRLVMGSRLDRPGERIVDFQTAQLDKRDRGWTTLGIVEGRGGGEQTYESPHIRYRHYLADRDHA